MNDHNVQHTANPRHTGAWQNHASSPSRPLLTLLVLFLLSLVGLMIFRDFVFGDKVLLYKDIGSDSINDSYPYFVHFSDYLLHIGFPSWSFSVGMGQSLSLFAGLLVWQPVVWLPRGLIPQALVCQHLLKAILIGLLFFRFLRLRNLEFQASLAGSLLLSFSAYMCMGSCWFVLADEAVGYTFILFAVEKAAREWRWYYLPLAIAFVSLLTLFHLYLGFLLICLYLPLRLVELHGWKPARTARICAQLIALSVIGAALTAVVSLDAADSLLHSPRGSGAVSLPQMLSSWPILKLGTGLHYLTVVLRSFSNDLMGTGSDFLGWQNYLEAPMSYCGILCLVILPQVFIHATRRERMLYGLVLGFVLVPTVFPWFRYLFWVFQGDYYRAYSLFSVFGILALSMTAFSRYLSKHSLNIPALAVTVVVSLAVLYCPAERIMSYIDPKLRNVIGFFLLGYSSVLAIGQLTNRQKLAGWLIITFTVVELIYFDHITVANRPTVTKAELKERRGYNDRTIEALRDIKARDTSFFRVTKTWASTPASSGADQATNTYYNIQNDALVFGYYGTSSYSSFNNLNYINFLVAVGAIPAGAFEEETRWAKGLQGRPSLLTFACEKYVLTKNPAPFHALREYDYKTIGNYDGIYVLENGMSLPFGLIYTAYIPESLFRELPGGLKESSLFYVAVLSGKHAVNGYGLTKLDSVELNQIIKEEYSVAQRRDMSFHMTSFSETQFAGTVSLKDKSVLIFQMAFDPGWHAFEDNVEVPVLRADVGLLGVALDPGNHQVVMRFVPRWFRVGGALSLLSFLIFAYLVWRRPRFPFLRTANELGV